MGKIRLILLGLGAVVHNLVQTCSLVLQAIFMLILKLINLLSSLFTYLIINLVRFSFQISVKVYYIIFNFDRIKLIGLGLQNIIKFIVSILVLIIKATLYILYQVFDKLSLLITFCIRCFTLFLAYIFSFCYRFFQYSISALCKGIFYSVKEVCILLYRLVKYCLFFIRELFLLLVLSFYRLIVSFLLIVINFPALIVNRFRNFSYFHSKKKAKQRISIPWRKNKKDFRKKFNLIYNSIGSRTSSFLDFALTIYNYIIKILSRFCIATRFIFVTMFSALKNCIFFVKNVVKITYQFFKILFIVLVSIFTKEFWLLAKRNTIVSAFYCRKFLTTLWLYAGFEIKHMWNIMIGMLKDIILFIWCDVLNIRLMIHFIRYNVLKFISLVYIFSFLLYGFIIIVFQKDFYDEISEKWSSSFVITNSSKILNKIVSSELFDPIIYYKAEIEVEKGQSLSNILLERGIDPLNSVAVINALQKKFDLRKINPSWILNAVIVSSRDWQYDKIQKLSLPVDSKFDLIIEADNDYNYSAYTQEKKLTRYILRRKITVRDSIYSSAITSGVPASIAVEVFKVLSWDIDFQRDIRENDILEVIFECVYNQDDDIVTCDNLLFASIKGNILTSFYKFKDGYYHEDGNSVIKTLVKTPVSNARLSSGFGSRKHPILGYTKMHKGIDFAAPVGTPIYASGGGVVESKYTSLTYGNYIRIRHNEYLSSVYAHMHNFARNIKVGDRVQQWQIIGYVGATGRVTGPHLHYEVLINRMQVNPLTIKMPSNSKLKEQDVLIFNNYKSLFNTLAVRIPTRGKMLSPLNATEPQGTEEQKITPS